MKVQNVRPDPEIFQTRTAVLNSDLHRHFERWYPGLKIEKNAERPASMLKMAA
jgi:hypothetical protein